jgi:hypothetical protein
MKPPQGPQQPHTPIRAVEPGTPEHAVWVAQQAIKRELWENHRALSHPVQRMKGHYR